MNAILRIAGMCLRHRWRLCAAYACMIGATTAFLLLPKYVGRAVDRIAEVYSGGAPSESAILGIVLVILGLMTIRGVLSFGQNYMGEALSQVVAYDLRNRFYDHVQHQSFGFHDRNHTGNLMSRAIMDVEAIRMSINMGLVRGPYFVLLFVVVAVLLIDLDWRLGLASIGFMPVVGLNSAMVRMRMRMIWLGVQERMAELNTITQENLTAVRVVKAFASESHEEAKFDVKNRETAQELVRAERLRAANMNFILFTFMVTLAVIMWLGGWLVIGEHLTWGELAQFIVYMQILGMPVRMFGWLVNSYARAASAGQRVFEVLDTESPVQEAESAREMPAVRGRVRFEKVGFRYDGGLPVLSDVSLESEPGQVVALLGAPGSGKTTVVSLIPRFYDVSEGSITIDGMDVRDATLGSLRRSIGIVQQDVFLFNSTIRENIAYGREDAPFEEVVEAARVAQLHDFVESLEHGYDTLVGERGSTLSGGQRQRLAIARAVLLDPPILIMDDSTSSVDTETEEQIRHAMESVMLGRTTFIIAHRLNTVHRADQILVLKEGRIVERGGHGELLAARGLYRDIYDLQLRPQEEVLREIRAPVPAGQGSASS